jgi:hypothetical protein
LTHSDDWGEKIPEEKIDGAAYTYRDCLDDALAAKCRQLLPTIYRKLTRIQDDTYQIKADTTQIKTNTKEILDRLEQFVGNSLGLANSELIRGISIPSPDSIPLPSAPFLMQEDLIRSLLADLDNHPWLALIDGPGKGKTQLAATLVRGNFGQVKWISLRNKGQHAHGHFRDQFALWLVEITRDTYYWEQYLNGLSSEKIVELIAEYSGLNGILVVDDLPDPVEFENIYLELEIFAQALTSRNIKIITTSQRVLPPFIVNRFRPFITRKSRPSFTSEDILLLLKQEAAPDDFQKEGVATWIAATTKGHPSLVAATLKWLEQSSWDYSLTTIDGLLTGEPVKETLEFSRRNLIRQLNNSEKELLYRFSIVGDSFTREQALEIAYISPKITNPGNVLDYLTGPWLDQFENQKFNVTPLLADSGKENLEFEVQQAVHRLLVKQITKHKVIEITKVHTLLIHLWQAHDYLEFGQVLFQAMMSVKTAAQAKYIEWTTSVLLDTKWPKEFDLNLKLLIRAAQICVASKAGRKIDKLNDDLEILINQANPESNLLALLLIFEKRKSQNSPENA